jgi:hypothetical protein
MFFYNRKPEKLHPRQIPILFRSEILKKSEGKSENFILPAYFLNISTIKFGSTPAERSPTIIEAKPPKKWSIFSKLIKITHPILVKKRKSNALPMLSESEGKCLSLLGISHRIVKSVEVMIITIKRMSISGIIGISECGQDI